MKECSTVYLGLEFTRFIRYLPFPPLTQKGIDVLQTMQATPSHGTLCPLCTRLADYRLMPGEKLRLSPGCQSSTALPTRAEHRPGAEARNQVSSLAAKRCRHRWQKLGQLQLNIISSQETGNSGRHDCS